MLRNKFARLSQSRYYRIEFNFLLSERHSNMFVHWSHTTAGHPEITWLQQTLDSCAAHNKKVWFTCHIPPGADAYASLHHQDKSEKKNVKII